MRFDDERLVSKQERLPNPTQPKSNFFFLQILLRNSKYINVKLNITLFSAAQRYISTTQNLTLTVGFRATHTRGGAALKA